MQISPLQDMLNGQLRDIARFVAALRPIRRAPQSDFPE